MIGLHLFHIARKWVRRGSGRLPEVCVAQSFSSMDGFDCWFTTDGQPLVWGIGQNDKQYVTIDDDVPIFTTDGQPLVYGA